MELSAEDRDLLALNLAHGIGPKTLNALLEKFGSASAVRDASPAELAEMPYMGRAVAEKLHTAFASRDVDAEIEELQKHGAKLLRLGSPEYPAALAEVPVPPRLLYVRGELLPRDREAVAIVGSRSCTSYGRKAAERIAYDLARAGVTIISGLARGIDGCAHRGALDAGGRTIAVMAGGLSKIYPPEHKELAAEVMAHGALISESAMKMDPLAGMFPARNRIISGLSRGVILVEANEKSGALITAHHAAEQGREVFAVPGQVDSSASEGTLRLLRQGAKLVRHAKDVLDDLAGLAPLTPVTEPGKRPPDVEAPSARPNVRPVGMTEAEATVWEMLDAARTIDEVCRHLGKSMGELASLLMTMEIRRLVRRLPGNIYERF
ncbi:MAG: DNA-processing protein DprA [Gemmataceae bacterium]|nr:DNA-processing protein DprA [Gemmataceae bacterium]